MSIRYRSHAIVIWDGPWTARRMPLVEFGPWYRCWREDFAIEVNVLGQWTPAHIVLATEVIPSAV
jgi:hypothetical protein